MKQVNQSVLKQNVTTNKHLAAVIRQRVILLAIRAIHMLLMIADMILSMMMEIMTGTDQKDKDYADGVDDAMEELDEDW